VQPRLDALQRAREDTERRFRDVGVPWDSVALADVQHASLRLLATHLELALATAGAAVRAVSDAAGGGAPEWAVELLVGAVTFTFKQQQRVGGLDAHCAALFATLSDLVCAASGLQTL